MKNRILMLVCCIPLTLSLTGCFTTHHTVGAGPATGVTETHHRWWALWGLVPISEKDVSEMAGGATNYKSTTQISFIDGVINFFTGLVTIYRTTVEIQK